MFWRDWPSWLKGIILAILIWIIVSLIFATFFSIIDKDDGFGGFAFVLALMFATFFPGYLVFGSLDFDLNGIQWVIAFIVSLIFWIILGLIIGWFIEKRKERKNTLPVQTDSLRT